jgi:flagellar biosynthesis chaperone FliJ
VPPRATTDVLLRLRQVDEREAMRSLEQARQVVEEATRTRDRVVGERADLLSQLEKAGTERPRMTVGTLVTREAYKTKLRHQLAEADAQVRTAERAMRTALQGLTEAQERVEQALRARQAAEKQRAAEDKALARRRERQDQAATDDRWRPPRR